MSWSFDKPQQKKWDDTGSQSSEFGMQSSSGFTPSESFQSYPSHTETLGHMSTEQRPTPPRHTPLRKTKTIDFEDFIKNKPGAFLYFSRKPETKNMFEPTDVERVNELMNKFSRSATTTYLGACLAAMIGDRVLRYKNLIYGMTYRSSILKFLLKYWMFPTIVANTAVGTYFAPLYEPQIMNIIDKYRLDDPFFKKIYEGDDPKNTQQQQTGTSL
jgi:hypothetical protein